MAASRPNRSGQLADRGCVVGGLDLHPVLAHAGLERLRRVDGHDLPVVDDGDPVAVLGLVHVVRGQEDGDVFPGLQVVDVLPDRRAGLRVQAHGRLVQEQHVRRVQQAAGDLQPPLHAARVGADQAVPAIPQPDHVEHLLHPRLHRRGRDGVQLRVEPEVLRPGQVVIQRGVLEHQPDVAAHRVPLADHVVAGHAGPPGGRPGQRAEDLDGGGLPGPVRPQEAERLSRRDLEVDAADRLDVPVALGQPGHGHRGGPGLQRCSAPAAGAGAGPPAPSALACVATLTRLLLVHAEPSRDGRATHRG